MFDVRESSNELLLGCRVLHNINTSYRTGQDSTGQHSTTQHRTIRTAQHSGTPVQHLKMDVGWSTETAKLLLSNVSDVSYHLAFSFDSFHLITPS